jgi:AhpD family alkylhydroperoxidase
VTHFGSGRSIDVSLAGSVTAAMPAIRPSTTVNAMTESGAPSSRQDCSPCVFAGVESAKRRGETEERLHNVVTWRETPFFTEEERAALALTEAATRIQDGAPGVTDEIWDAAAPTSTRSS